MPHGFEAWYRAEHPRLLASLILLTGNLDVARDATDEALARALAHWDRVGAMESPGGWTYRVALNVVRRRQRRAALEQRLLLRRLPVPTFVPPDEAAELWEMVRALPERQRTAVVLRYLADLPEHEIADLMGVARGTVAATLSAARTRLARLLAEEPRLTFEVPGG